MPFSAVYDACVLYPFEIRDILMVAARTRYFAVYWTDEILMECARNLIADGRATREGMDRMFRDMFVSNTFEYPHFSLILNPEVHHYGST